MSLGLAANAEPERLAYGPFPDLSSLRLVARDRDVGLPESRPDAKVPAQLAERSALPRRMHGRLDDPHAVEPMPLDRAGYDDDPLRRSGAGWPAQRALHERPVQGHRRPEPDGVAARPQRHAARGGLDDDVGLARPVDGVRVVPDIKRVTAIERVAGCDVGRAPAVREGDRVRHGVGVVEPDRAVARGDGQHRRRRPARSQRDEVHPVRAPSPRRGRRAAPAPRQARVAR